MCYIKYNDKKYYNTMISVCNYLLLFSNNHILYIHRKHFCMMCLHFVLSMHYLPWKNIFFKGLWLGNVTFKICLTGYSIGGIPIKFFCTSVHMMYRSAMLEMTSWNKVTHYKTISVYILNFAFIMPLLLNNIIFIIYFYIDFYTDWEIIRNNHNFIKSLITNKQSSTVTFSSWFFF